MNFGFSYVGLIYLVMLFVPNIIWAKHKPQDYEKYAQHENRLLLLLERTGEVSVSAIVLIFDDFNIHRLSPWSLFLLAAFVLMIMYELYWIRYFRSEHTMKDMYSSFCGFPVAGASLPVFAAALIALYGKNILLLCAAAILGVGHIGIHLNHRKEVLNNATSRQ